LVNLLAAAPGVALYLLKLRLALRQIDPDVLHANGLKAHVLSVWARPGTRALIVWHVHDYVSRRPLMSRLLSRYSRRCAAAVVNSRSVGEDLRSVCGGGLKTFTLYNAVDLENFSPEGGRVDLDSLSGMPPAPVGTIRVGLLATMARWKGHETFLKSLSLLPSDAPVRGYIIGGSIYQTHGSQFNPGELRELASRLGLGGRVGFTGFVEDSAAAIRSLDVLVHASTEPEPFGLVVVEGMACGLPVIASQAGGAAEIISMGDGPLGHAPGDAENLSSQIRKLAGDAELRARRGQAGRSTAERCFDRARLAGALAMIYREAAAAR
jgi:glycosyltransferase involved in cell wall biosynthesis